MINIFIGYDPREAIAYHVCTNSIIRRSSQPVALNPLALNALKGYDEKHTDGSNHFIYSRFLVHHLMNYKGWAIFIDGDMIVRDDINELWEMRDDTKAVMVVKHDYQTKMAEKYLGAKNENYPRKNWSSMILWNCAHPANRAVTPEMVNKETGQYLHRFSWLKDEEIGSVDHSWNWLVGWYKEPKDGEPKVLHYTEGGPWFKEYRDCEYSDVWKKYLANMLKIN